MPRTRMRLRFRCVAVGGTFDTLHSGHIKLLATAALVGERVWVGVTSDRFAASLKRYAVRPFTVRLMSVRGLMDLIAPERKAAYVELDDPYGPAATDNQIDAIVVSVETAPRAFEINDARARQGMRPLDIVVISTVRDGYGNRLSSTYLRSVLEARPQELNH